MCDFHVVINNYTHAVKYFQIHSKIENERNSNSLDLIVYIREIDVGPGFTSPLL